jgi:hypothetical protein
MSPLPRGVPDAWGKTKLSKVINSYSQFLQRNFFAKFPRIFQRRRVTVSHSINRFWSFWKILELFSELRPAVPGE